MKTSKSVLALLLIVFTLISFESNAQTTTDNSWWQTFKSYFVSNAPTNQKATETLKDRTGSTTKTPTTVKDKPESIKDRPGSVKDKPAPVKTPTTVKDNPESIKDRPGKTNDKPVPVKDRPAPVKDRPTNINTSSKAKCGVPGCQHPGKHEGLHKHQDVVAPIMFEKGKSNNAKGKSKGKSKGKGKSKNNKNK